METATAPTSVRHRVSPSSEGLPVGTSAVLSALPGWWRSRAERAGLSGSWLDLHTAVAAQPPAGIDAAIHSADLHAGWSDGHAVGLSYVESLSSSVRSVHGRHYTPAVLSDRLWAMARSALRFGVDDRSLPGLVRDPACGAGALLLPAIREHLRANENTEPAMVIAGLASHIQGVDLDEYAVYVANVVLAAEALSTVAKVPESRRRPIPVMAIVGDGLATDREPALVTIVNPPYGRLTLSGVEREQFANVLYGHANLYGMFMAAGAANLAERGVLAALVPTSFTSGLYFHRLRSYLADTAPLRSLTFVQDRSGVFSGVLQETCLAVFSKTRHHKVEVSRANGRIVQVASVPVPKTGAPWLLPRESADAALAAAAAGLPLSLKDTGWHASTGPLVWNRRKADLHARPARTRTRVLWAADIDGGVIHRDRGRDTLRYLRTEGTPDERTMVMTSTAVLVQRTTSPEQSRRLVAVELTAEDLAGMGGRVVVENHVNVLRPSTGTPLLSQALLARLLSTRTLDRLMRCISGSVAVSSYELAALPMPDAETLTEWETLTGDDLERAVASAYRLPALK